jgi:TolA-binding protein
MTSLGHLAGPAVLVLTLVLGACAQDQGRINELADARQAFSQGHYFEAERMYEAYLQTHPRGAERWEAWSRILDISLNVRGDQEKAAGILEAMILEYGDEPERAWSVLSRLADVYVDLKRWDRATATLHKLLNIPSLGAEQQAEVHMRLAAIYQSQREYDLAQDALASCMELAREDETLAACMYDQARVMSYIQNWARAKKLLNGIRGMTRVSQERKALATFMLADIHEHEDDFATARDLLRSIRHTYPNPKVVEQRLENIRERLDG